MMHPKTYYYYILLTLITIVVFFFSFLNDFQRAWDDQWQVLDYEFVTNHSLESLIYHFTHFHLGQYFPVNTLLYIAVFKIFGFNPMAFHAACLIIHLLNIILVYNIVQKILKQVKPRWSTKKSLVFAFISTLIFAIHPLQVESIAWISASKILLYAFFFLLGIWFYLRYLNTSNWRWLTGVAVAYLLAYGSKEQAIIFPLNLIAFDFLFNRLKGLKFSLSTLKKRVVLEKIPFLLLALLLYYFSVSNNLGTFYGENYPVDQRLIFGMSSFMEYLFRFIAPVKLYYFYFFPIELGDKLPLYFWMYPVLVVICLTFIITNYRRNNSIIVFGFLLFLINLLLVLHIIPMPRKMITADRYMYFSIIGLGIITTWLGFYCYNKLKKWRKLLVLAFTCWILFLGIHAHFRTREWKDSESVKMNITKLIERRKQNNQPIVNNPIKDKTDEKN